MATIITRETGATAKGSPLTNAEVDNNFINLNTEVTPSRPTIRPSLLLDFANSKLVDSRITFTRASAATYYNDKGVLQLVRDNKPRIDFNPTTGECKGLLIEEQRTNLLTYSSEFSNAAWQKTRASIIANIIVAPDGTLTGDKLVEDTAAGSHTVRNATSVTIASGTTLTASAYFKAAEGTFAIIGIGDGAGINISRATFDLSSETITVTYTANANVSTPITSFTPVGNGWYRCSVTATLSNVTVAQAWYWKGQNSNGNASYTGDGNSGIYIWGAQLEAGAFATSYIPTTATFTSRASSATYFDSTGVLRTAGVNQARYNYGYESTSGKWISQGLLLEAAATNLLATQPRASNFTAWNVNGASINTSVKFIDGVENVVDLSSASIATPNLSNSNTVSTSTGTTYTYSVFVKAYGSHDVVSLWVDKGDGTIGATSQFKLSTISSTTVALRGGMTVQGTSIVPVGNGWFRLSMTVAGTMPATSQVRIYVAQGNYGQDNDGYGSAIGSIQSNSGMYVHGFQFEASPVATSYIPTYGAAVTRAADVSSSAATTRVTDSFLVNNLADFGIDRHRGLAGYLEFTALGAQTGLTESYMYMAPGIRIDVNGDGVSDVFAFGGDVYSYHGNFGGRGLTSKVAYNINYTKATVSINGNSVTSNTQTLKHDDPSFDGFKFVYGNASVYLKNIRFYGKLSDIELRALTK